jgi:Na+/proline symporter
MIGLLVCGIFAATMSSMDSGLNKNAGFFVRNFYRPILRQDAHERELLYVAKTATVVLGVLVILAALTFSTWKEIGLFDLMLQFGALVAVPYTIPLIWGLLIKRAPSWAGWTTVLVGFACSLLSKTVFTPSWAERMLGWSGAPLNLREQSDWALVSSIFLTASVCSAWFLAACLFWRQRGAAEVERVKAFFEQVETPVDFAREIGEANDSQQYRLMGVLCLIYGAFTTGMVLIPNPLAGRVAILACGASVLGVGLALSWQARRAAALEEPKKREAS